MAGRRTPWSSSTRPDSGTEGIERGLDLIDPSVAPDAPTGPPKGGTGERYEAPVGFWRTRGFESVNPASER